MENEFETISILLVDDEFLELKVLELKLASSPEFKVMIDYASNIADAVEKTRQYNFDLILMDNRLLPNNDFRETVPQLRQVGFTGPIGVVSADISGPYFQQFEEYGVDFRIGKDEIDYHAIRHIISEYVKSSLPDDWDDGGMPVSG
ncbi:response regulator [Rhizobium halophytocola]|uniref:DNA-binding NarL/FixJ family response regulator n=1 Tax=Rhizobium halophytocola TaxID=735519 RepID=A0ABS4E262_9HYPH|nr:response regulator [Rhizobium halophytocola]MBP1852017.1 DNA-binding NarL/FixJ family response regulator [Rhizobium halophytocola]